MSLRSKSAPKTILKKAVLDGLDVFGINGIFTRSRSHNVLVLGYHGILSEPKAAPFRYHHTLAEFQSHLDWLTHNCQPITLAELARWRAGEWKPAKPPALITFDDGYRNNATIAAPLLRSRGIPAVFFLSTGYIGTPNILWPEEIFLRVTNWPREFIGAPHGANIPLPSETLDRHALAYKISEACKNSPDADRREYLEYLRGGTAGLNVVVDPEAQEFMSWSEARSLVASGFDVGSHTVSHPILSRLSPADVRQELSASRRAIREQTGSPCNAVAYPNGRPQDFNEDVIAATDQCGYEFAFVVSGRWSSAAKPRLEVDRVLPPGHADRSTFSFYASGIRLLLQTFIS